MAFNENAIIYDEEFFEEVKSELAITWSDDATNLAVKNYIKQGVGILQSDVESQIDFEKSMVARQLLKTYCRYARNNSAEFFIENNIQFILKLELEYGKD